MDMTWNLWSFMYFMCYLTSTDDSLDTLKGDILSVEVYMLEERHAGKERWKVMANSKEKKMVLGETHPEFLLQQKPRGTRESSKTMFAVLIYKETAQLEQGNISCLWRLQCEAVSI